MHIVSRSSRADPGMPYDRMFHESLPVLKFCRFGAKSNSLYKQFYEGTFEHRKDFEQFLLNLRPEEGDPDVSVWRGSTPTLN